MRVAQLKSRVNLTSGRLVETPSAIPVGRETKEASGTCDAHRASDRTCEATILRVRLGFCGRAATIRAAPWNTSADQGRRGRGVCRLPILRSPRPGGDELLGAPLSEGPIVGQWPGSVAG